jgi:hypothetical protein
VLAVRCEASTIEHMQLCKSSNAVDAESSRDALDQTSTTEQERRCCHIRSGLVSRNKAARCIEFSMHIGGADMTHPFGLRRLPDQCYYREHISPPRKQCAYGVVSQRESMERSAAAVTWTRRPVVRACDVHEVQFG